MDYVRGDYRLLGDASYMSIFHKAPHPNAAKAFIDFFLDDESMNIMAKAGEFVNRKGVYPPVPDADKIKFVEMDDLGENFLRRETKRVSEAVSLTAKGHGSACQICTAMLKDLFDKGKCALGFHSGDWRYVDDRGCQQVRICPRCNNQSQQTVHGWQAWQYVANGACDMARQCGRCHEQENRLEHSWGAPVYESDEVCTQVRPCARCGAKSAAGTSHVWTSWTYDGKGRCAQTSACSRCGTTGRETRLAHEWDDWHTSKFYAAPVRVCGAAAS